MEQELKKKWVTALKSGNYTQGIGSLYRPVPNTYCCLGVLLEVAGKDKEEFNHHGKASFFLNYIGEKCPIPLDLETKLIEMNDTWVSFPQIAEYIEQNG